MLLLTVLTTAGAWAQTIVMTEDALRSAITDGALYKDGNWSTLSLPFAVTDGDESDGLTFSGTPLEGATVVTLDSATYENGTLTLNFEEATAIEPGKPYLIKWANDPEHPAVIYPEFYGVTISNTSTSENAIDAGIITFKGQYDAQHIGEDGDSTLLYLGTYSTFRYPDGEMIIGSCRAYFKVKTDLGDVNGDGQVNITDVTVLINHLLTDDASLIVIEKADINGDGEINITDVTVLISLVLGDNCMINNINVVVNGAEGLTFGGFGTGPAR